MIEWLAMTPLVAATLCAALLAIKRPGRRRYISLALLLLISLCASGLVVLNGIHSSCRCVVVLDLAELSESARKSLQILLTGIEKIGLAGYDLVLIDRSKKTAVNLDLTNRGWGAGADGVVRNYLISDSAEAAILLAIKRLDTMPWYQRLWDTLCLRSRRVFVLATQQKAWREDRLNIRTVTEAALYADVSVDLIVDRLEDPTPTLEIICSPQVLPADSRPHSNRIILNLKSSQLGASAGTQVNYETICEIDPDAPAQNRYVHSVTGRTRVSSTGEFRLEIALSNFKQLGDSGEFLTLSAGFHLLRCKVKLLGLGQEVNAQAETYLRSGRQKAIIVAGSGGALGPPVPAELIKDAWERLPYSDQRRPAEVSYDVWDENVLKNATEPPPLLILNDLSQDAWLQCADKIRRWIDNGIFLMVCLPPPATSNIKAKVQFLPALARSTTEGKAFRLIRRPRLTIVLDGSQLGKLPYAPTNLQQPSEDITRSKFGMTGEAVQREVIQKVCEKLQIIYNPNDASGNLFPESGGYLQTGILQAKWPNQGSAGAEYVVPSQLNLRLGMMLPGNMLPAEYMSRGVEPFPVRPDEEIGVNDIVVVFTYDVLADGQSVGHLARQLARGTTIVDVRLKNPFVAGANVIAKSLGTNYSKTIDQYIQAELSQLSSAGILTADEAKSRYHGGDEFVLSQASDGNMNVRINRLAESIAGVIRPRISPREGVVVRHALDRFISESTYPEALAGTGVARETLDQAHAAPIRLLALESVAGQGYASIMRYPGDTGQIGPKPLIQGTLVGRGSVEVLGYSPFEGVTQREANGVLRYLGIEFDKYGSWDRKARLNPAISYDYPIQDLWGVGRIYDFVGYHSKLERPPSETPRLNTVTLSSSRGRLRIACQAKITSNTLASLEISGDAGKVLLSPADVDPTRGHLIFELPLNKQLAMLGTASGHLRTGYLHTCGEKIWVPARKVDLQSDLDPLAEVAATAHFSGGEVVSSGAGIPVRQAPIRVPAALGFSGALASLWVYWAANRLGLGRRLSRSARVESERGKPLDSEGLIAQVGDSLGTPSAAVRSGAFAGYRQLEPGDRLDAAVRQEVVAMTFLSFPVLPRVSQRIQENATRVMIVVRLGRSMRQPRSRHSSGPKVITAAVICDLLSSLACSRRAEVTLMVSGLSADYPQLGPFTSPPGTGYVRKWVESALTCRSTGVDKHYLPASENGSVFYVSDFLEEDSSRLMEEVASIESDGGKAAGVHVFSETEFLLTGLGVAGRSGVFERSGFTEDDLRQAHLGFLAELYAHWDCTHGGLAVASASMSEEQLLAVLTGNRMFNLLG